jgi:Flp pilus assembly protein TadD
MFRGLFCLIAALLLLPACGTSPYAVQSDISSGNFEGAAKRLEERRDGDPDDLDTRLELADVYYQLARKSLDEGNQTAYVDYLRKAQVEILAAVDIDPTSPRPHTWLGIITAYQGDLTASETSFKNARRLSQSQPREMQSGTYDSNLAHIAVYQGKLPDARRYLQRAAKNFAPQDEMDRIMVLAAWKANDMVEARDIFNSAVTLSPAFAGTWDGAPLPKPMQSFDDFAAVCCANPTCGPHMEGACKREKQTVVRREIDLDTVNAERKLEIERQQKLREIYKRRKDVEITIEPEKPAPTATTPPAKTPVPTTAAPKAPAPAPKP